VSLNAISFGLRQHDFGFVVEWLGNRDLNKAITKVTG